MCLGKDLLNKNVFILWLLSISHMKIKLKKKIQENTIKTRVWWNWILWYKSKNNNTWDFKFESNSYRNTKLTR